MMQPAIPKRHARRDSPQLYKLRKCSSGFMSVEVHGEAQSSLPSQVLYNLAVRCLNVLWVAQKLSNYQIT